MYLRDTYYDFHINIHGVNSSCEQNVFDSEKLVKTGSFLHIKCLRLCNSNKTKMVSVFTMSYLAFLYMLNGDVSIIMQCKYTSLEELICEVSSSLAFKRCHPMPLLKIYEVIILNQVSFETQ